MRISETFLKNAGEFAGILGGFAMGALASAAGVVALAHTGMGASLAVLAAETGATIGGAVSALAAGSVTTMAGAGALAHSTLISLGATLATFAAPAICATLAVGIGMYAGMTMGREVCGKIGELAGKVLDGVMEACGGLVKGFVGLFREKDDSRSPAKVASVQNAAETSHAQTKETVVAELNQQAETAKAYARLISCAKDICPGLEITPGHDAEKFYVTVGIKEGQDSKAQIMDLRSGLREVFGSAVDSTITTDKTVTIPIIGTADRLIAAMDAAKAHAAEDGVRPYAAKHGAAKANSCAPAAIGLADAAPVMA